MLPVTTGGIALSPIREIHVTKPKTPAELRAEAVAEARASLRMEGLAISASNEDLFAEFIEGTMTGDEVRQQIIARV